MDRCKKVKFIGTSKITRENQLNQNETLSETVQFGCVFKFDMLVLGYKNEDWFIPYPALNKSDSDLDLSPQLAEETLNYFGK